MIRYRLFKANFDAKLKKNTRYLLHTVVLLVLCLSKNLLLIINALSLMVKPILPVILV
jgi:hypothetical protein